jgi:hypothetical protein
MNILSILIAIIKYLLMILGVIFLILIIVLWKFLNNINIQSVIGGDYSSLSPKKSPKKSIK